MSITEQLSEYKSRIEALSTKAAQAEQFEEQVKSLAAEKSSLAESLGAKETALVALGEKATALETEVAQLKADIEKRDAEKKATDEKALQIVAELGLKTIPVVTITETSKPTAESIRAKYMAMTDPVEKGKFFVENRNAILNGVID